MDMKFMAIFKSRSKAEDLFEYLNDAGPREVNGGHELELCDLVVDTVGAWSFVSGAFNKGTSLELDFWCKVDRSLLLRDVYFFDNCSYTSITYSHQSDRRVKYGTLECCEDVYDLDSDTDMFADVGIPNDMSQLVLNYFQ